ncbi:MAG: NAD(P)H-hydrate dehydratase [bacterium]
MKLYRTEDAKRADSYAINKIGVPSVVLMEHAARGVFEEIVKRFTNIHLNNFIVVYGTGNNGGDALCLARMLLLAGCKVKLVEAIGKPKTPDSKLQLKMLTKTAIKNDMFSKIKSGDVLKNINSKTVVIDGVFGTGFNVSKSKQLSKNLIKLLGSLRKALYVISIDVPSGVDADTGEVINGAIKADCTVSFVYPKLGLFISPASINSGDIVIKPLFFPTEKIDTKYELITENMVREMISPIKRKPDSHKGIYGHVAVLSPEQGMEGAVAMTAMAALRAGAGLVTILAVNESTESIRQRMPMLTPEIMILNLTINEKNGAELTQTLVKFNSIIIGPGFGKKRKLILNKILKYADVPLVIDADALNLISEDSSLFTLIKNKDVILTPHPGEMTRLVSGLKKIQDHRLNILEQFVKRHNICVLLKGYRSMLARKDGMVFINQTGNPALSKAGSGDTLSGIIGAFIAQGTSVWASGVLGMYVHGLCADRLIMDEKKSDFGILPTDIINELGSVIKCLTE